MLKPITCALAFALTPFAVRAPEAAPTALGPPTICFPIDIGDAASLPFADGDKKPAYEPFAPVSRGRGDDSWRFIEDTLALLTPETPPLVRMETLRRATFYAHGMTSSGRTPAGAAERLLADVLTRALDAEASQYAKRVVAAWFDAAWLRGCYSDVGEFSSTRAYDWLQRGFKLGGKDVAEYEFAAAVLTMHAKELGRESLAGFHAGHIRRAAEAAEEGSTLARNIVTRFARDGATLKTLRGT